MLAQDPEISPGQDDRSKFNTPNRKLAWIPWILHRKVFVWKFWTEKGLGTLCLWHPSDGCEDLSWPIAGACTRDRWFVGRKQRSKFPLIQTRHTTNTRPFLFVFNYFTFICGFMCVCMHVWRSCVSMCEGQRTSFRSLFPHFYSEDSGNKAQLIRRGSAFTTETSCPTPIFFFKDNVTPSTGWPQTYYVANDDLELLVLLSLPPAPRAEITGMYYQVNMYHVGFMWYWGSNPVLCAC